MADGLTSLATLNYGTSTGGAAGAGETTLTLGQDRKDVQNPPDVYHVWNSQISQCKNLLLLMTADSKGGTRALVRPQTSNPFGVTESGYYIDTTGKFWGVYNGTPTQLTGGGGSTGNWTFSLNNSDLSGAGTMGVGSGGTATAVQIGTATTTQTLGAIGSSGAGWSQTWNPFYMEALTSSGGATLKNSAIFNFQPRYWNGSADTTYNIGLQGVADSTGPTTHLSVQFGGTEKFQLNSGGSFNLLPSASINNISQGATNTTGLTISPNVVDGASSVGLVVNNATALTSGKMVSLRNNGTERLAFVDDGTITRIQDTGRNLLQLYQSDNTGIYADGVGGFVYLMISNFIGLKASLSEVASRSDNTSTLGDISNQWSSVYSYSHVTKAQANTVGATFTINPASGSFVKQTLTSATNVTAVTISAGVDGQELEVHIIQPAAGTAATVVTTWTNVSFAGGAGSFTATLGKRDVYKFRYDSTTSKWYERSRALNLTN